MTFQPEFSDGSSVVSGLAETSDFSFLIVGLVVLFSLVATSFIVISKRNVNAFSGAHSVSSVSSINVLRKVLIVFISASLVVGSVASFKAAFADEVGGDEISFSAVVYYDSNYGVSTVDVSVANHSNFEVTIPASALSGIWCGELSSSENLDTGQTFSKIFYPEDETLSEQIIYRLTDSPVLSIENGSPAPNVPFCFYVNYEGWKATFLQNIDVGVGGIKKDNGEAWLDCANNTCLNYVPEIGDYLKKYALEYGYTFVEWNTSADGTGETVDAAYLASHPLTSDVNYYAIWKNVDADSPSADDSQNDNPAQPGTPGDATDTPEVTDPDANAEAEANKNIADATDPVENVEGTKEGDEVDQTV